VWPKIDRKWGGEIETESVVSTSTIYFDCTEAPSPSYGVRSVGVADGHAARGVWNAWPPTS